MSLEAIAPCWATAARELPTEADVEAAVARLPTDQLWIFSSHRRGGGPLWALSRP